MVSAPQVYLRSPNRIFLSRDGFLDPEEREKIVAVPGAKHVTGGWEWGWSPTIAIELHQLGYELDDEVYRAIEFAAESPDMVDVREISPATTWTGPWRSQTPPREHQARFKSWRRGGAPDGVLRPAALLEAGKGLGKTLMAIEEMLEFRARNGTFLGLVLVRNPLMETVWAEQIRQHAPSLTFTVLAGPRTKRLKRLQGDIDSHGAEVFIHNHEDLPGFKKHLLAVNWDFIVLDESGRFRNASAKRTGILTGFRSKVLDAPQKLALTGNQQVKRYADYYPILRWLGAPVGDKAQFMERYVIQGGWSEELALRDEEEFLSMLAAWRFLVPKGRVLDLPRAWHYERLEFAPWQREQYARVQRELRTRFVNPDTGEVTEAAVRSRLTELLRLAEVTAGFESIGDRRWTWRDDNVKARTLFGDVLPEFIEAEEQVIIWGHFNAEIENLHRMARERWPDLNATAFYGSGRDRENLAAYHAFSSGASRLLFASMAQASAGLNLPSAHVAVFYTRSYDTEAWEQALERNARLTTILRDGETLNVVVLEVANTVDENVTRVLGDDIRKAARVTAVDVKEVLGL